MTSRNFSFTSGTDYNNGYSAEVNDVSNANLGVADVNGVRTWKWDTVQGTNQFFSGTGFVISFTEGTTSTNGVWEDYAGTVGTRSGNSISFGTARTFTDTSAFVGGVIPSTGGTSTEGSSNPSGSFYFNSQSQLVFVVNSTSPSSDGNIVYKIFRRTVNQVMGHAYTVTHSNGSPTEFSIGLDLSLYDRWELRVESSTALVDSATMSVYSTAPKKVFCNFW